MIMQTHPCREPQEVLFALIRKDESRTVSYEQPQEEYFQAQVITDLIEAIEHNHGPRLSPEHSRHVIEVLEAIEKAAVTGNRITLSTTI